MAEDLGDARLALSTDQTELDRGLDAGEAKTRSFLDRVGGATKATYKVVAGAVATGLAAATVQGAQLNEVLNDLQAETGATGADWEAMQAVVRRENGRTTESIDDIGAATKAMRQDLNLTGADIDKYADKFFDAALVTKESGEQIVKTTDDIADGFGVNVDRAIGSIDQIIASQEKWGGSIQDRLAVLPTLAKGLKGLNGTLDDGIALLNVASASGLEYSSVQQAVNVAVSKFAVPRALKDIIGLQDKHKTAVELAKDEVIKLEDELAQFVVPSEMVRILATLTAIEDPTKRAAAAERIYADEVAKFSADPITRYLDILGEIPDAQARTTRAVELFGPKAGPVWAQLAGAVEQAGGNLDSFNVTQAEAGNKATEVARKLDAGPIRSLKLLGESLGGLLADAGSNPLITGIASFGTILGGFAPNLSGKIAGGIVGAIKGAWTKVAGSAAVSAVVKMAAGKAATVYLTALIAGDMVSDALRGAWSRVVGSTVVQAIIRKAGTTAAAAYLVAILTGDAIGSALQSAWAATGGRVAAAAAASGATAGTAFAVAAAAAIVAAPLIVLKVALDIQGDVDRQAAGVQKQAADFVTTASDKDLAQAIDGVRKQFDGMVFNTFDSKNKVAETLNQLIAEQNRRYYEAKRDARGAVADITDSFEGLGPAINDGLERSAAAVGGGGLGTRIAETVVDDFATHMTSSIGFMGPNWAKVAHEQGNRLGASVADGIHASRDLVDSAWQALLDAIHHGTTPTRERAKLLGQLVSNDLVWGLKSKDPAVRAQARATKQVILDRLAELGANTKNIGKSGMAALEKAMKSKDADIRAAARTIYNAAVGPKSPIAKIPGQATTWGEKTTESYAAGLRSRVDLVASAAGAITKALGNQLRASSPPGPESELHEIDKWGARTGQAWIEPLVAAIHRGRAGLVAAVAGVGDAISSRRFPSLTASIVPRPLGFAAIAAAGSVGNGRGLDVSRETTGGPIHEGDIHVHMLDRYPVESVRDIAGGLEMLEEQGYLGRHRRTPPPPRRAD